MSRWRKFLRDNLSPHAESSDLVRQYLKSGVLCAGDGLDTLESGD